MTEPGAVQQVAGALPCTPARRQREPQSVLEAVARTVEPALPAQHRQDAIPHGADLLLRPPHPGRPSAGADSSRPHGVSRQPDAQRIGVRHDRPTEVSVAFGPRTRSKIAPVAAITTTLSRASMVQSLRDHSHGLPSCSAGFMTRSWA